MNIKVNESKNMSFSSLYDSIVGEDGAYDNVTRFLGSLRRSVAGGAYYYGYLPNNQLSEFYNFEVNYTMPEGVLKDIINALYSSANLYGDGYKNVLEKFKRIFGSGNIVSIRLDTPFMKHNESLPSGVEYGFSQYDTEAIRDNHLYLIIAEYLVNNGVLSPLNENRPSCTFETTELSIFDLIHLMHQDKSEESIKSNPAQIGFENYANGVYLPRFVSYRELKPEMLKNPLGETIKKYHEKGTGVYSVADFTLDFNNANQIRKFDLFFATSFLFMAINAANLHNKNEVSGLRFTYDSANLSSEVNPLWIRHAIDLAVKYHERMNGSFNLYNVIKLICSVKKSDVEYCVSHHGVSDMEEMAKKYVEDIKHIYGKDSVLFKELMEIDPKSIQKITGQHKGE